MQLNWLGLPGRGIKNSPAMQEMEGHRFDSWVRKILSNRKWQAAPVFLPVEFHRLSSLPGGLQSMKSRSRTRLSTHTHLFLGEQ